MRTDETESSYRAKRRGHYFEEPSYRKWPDFTGPDRFGYGNYRERAFLKYYLCGECHDDEKLLSNLHDVLKNGKSHSINWEAFYAYFDERLNDPENKFREEMNEEIFPRLNNSPTVIKLLNQYRYTLLSPNYNIV